MPRNAEQYLEDIVLAVRRIQEYVADFDFDEYVATPILRDAVERNLIIIGEAAGKLPESIRQREPSVDWGLAAAMRNIVVREYFGVDQRIVWDVVSNELAPLAAAAGRLLSERDPGAQ